MDGEPLQADFIDVTVSDERCHSSLYITRRYAAASRSHCRNCQAHWNGIAETIYDDTRENTRLRDLYLLSMEMCFHKAGTWNNLPDNPWHWGSWKVRWTIRDGAASQLRVCSPPPCLNLLNTWVFFTLLMHYPLESYSIWCDRFMWSNNEKFISTLTALHYFQKAERLPGTSAGLETKFLSPLASGMTIPVFYVKEIWMELWSLPGHTFLRSSWASSISSLSFRCLEAEESQALWEWWNYSTQDP